MKKIIMTILALVLSSTVLVGSASALYIQGGLSMTGEFRPTPSPPLLSATGLDFFNDDPDPLVEDQMRVTSGYDDFGALPSLGVITDFIFTPINSGSFNLYTVGDFTFRLDSWTVTGPANNSIGTGLGIQGLGYFIDNNGVFDDTPGVWIFTGQTADDRVHSWSANAATTAVPEPATMILIGTGLVGLFGTRIRRKK